MAVFDSLLNTPCVRYILTICVIALKHFDRNCFNKSVGIGSSLQVLVVMLIISFLTSSSVRGANLLNIGAFDGLGVYCSVFTKSFLIVFISLRKQSVNSSAHSSGFLSGGRFGWLLLVTLLTILNNCLVFFLFSSIFFDIVCFLW